MKTAVQRGDVVLVKYPFADGSEWKVRPALVIQCEANNSRLDNTIVAQITSRVRFAKSEPTQLFIEISSIVGQQSGLLHDSAVSCENIYTVRQDIIVRKVGSLPQDAMEKVNRCLIVALDLD